VADMIDLSIGVSDTFQGHSIHLHDDWSANKKCGNNSLTIFSWYIPPPPPEINEVNLEVQDLDRESK
jgi:hypothetical protein